MIFASPIPPAILIGYGGKAYHNIGQENIDTSVNKYPLDHTDWVQAQKVISNKFNDLIKNKWSSNIAHEIWDFVKDDFDFDIGKQITVAMIDPILISIFLQIKQYQQTILY